MARKYYKVIGDDGIGMEVTSMKDVEDILMWDGGEAVVEAWSLPKKTSTLLWKERVSYADFC